MRKLWMSALLGLLLLLLTAACAYAEKTTIMMYMCGTDIQEDCITDMKEIAAASYGSDVNVVVLAGGTKKWSDSRLQNGRLNQFTISNGQLSAVTDKGKASMGKPETLVTYVNETLKAYPADRYVLILWDHGGGAASGVCFDELYNDDALTIPDIRTALSSISTQNNGFKFDILGCDACLMASYELAAAVSDYAHYLVASEELEPYLGWNYKGWLTALGGDPAMSDAQLCAAIVNSFKEACERDNPKDYYTLSAIDLTVMDALKACIESLAPGLTQSVTSGGYNTMSRTFRSMYNYGSFDGSGSDMVDLTAFLNFCANTDSTTAAAALSALNSAVVCCYASAAVPEATGLSIYVPMETASELKSILSDYEVDETANYTAFIKAFAGQTNSGSYSFSNTGSPSAMDNGAMNSQGFLDSAFSYSYGSCSDDWCWNDDEWCYDDDDYGSVSWGYGGSYGNGYGYGSGFGYNGTGYVIAGTAGTVGGTGTTVTTTQSGIPIVIAGTAGTAAAPTAPPAQTGGIVIAGTTAPPAAATETVLPSANTDAVTLPSAITNASGYSLTLSDEDMDNLAYAELTVMMDLSEDGDTQLLDLGTVRDTWVDWSANTVYALFDGSWPCLNDMPVMLIDQSKTERIRRSLIPVRVNGVNTYLVVVFEGSSKDGRILGTSPGWTETGAVSRSVSPLRNGDSIELRYKLWYEGEDGKLEYTDFPETDDTESAELLTFVYDGTQTVTYADLTDESDPTAYRLSFRLYDVYGENETTQYTTLTY